MCGSISSVGIEGEVLQEELINIKGEGEKDIHRLAEWTWGLELTVLRIYKMKPFPLRRAESTYRPVIVLLHIDILPLYPSPTPPTSTFTPRIAEYVTPPYHFIIQ